MERVDGIRASTADTTNAESNPASDTMIASTADMTGRFGTAHPGVAPNSTVIPASDPAFTLTMNEEQHTTDIVTDDPSGADGAAHPTADADDSIQTAQGLANNQIVDDIHMPDVVPSIFGPISEHTDDASTYALQGVARVFDGALMEDPIPYEGHGSDVDDPSGENSMEQGLTEGEHSVPDGSAQNEDDGIDLFGDDVVERDVTEGEVMDTTIREDPNQVEYDGSGPFEEDMADVDLPQADAMDTINPEDPNQDDGKAYESDPDAFKDTGSDDDDGTDLSLANIVAMEARLNKGPRITQRGAFDPGSEDDSSSTGDEDSDDEDDVAEDNAEDDSDDAMEREMKAAMNEEYNVADEVANAIASADGEDAELPEAGSQTFGADGLNGHTGAGFADVGLVTSLLNPPHTDLDPAASATKGYQTLPNGMIRTSRHLSDSSSDEDSDDQQSMEDSHDDAADDNAADDNAVVMVEERNTHTAPPADLEDDEMDMEDIFNDLATKEPAAPPTPPLQPKPKPKRNAGQGKKRSLDEMRVGRQHRNSNEPQLGEGVSNGGTQLPFVPTRLKRAVNRGPRGAPRRADPDEVRQSGSPPQHSKTVPAVSETKPPSTLPISSTSLPMSSTSLPMPSRSAPMPTLSLPVPSSSLPMPTAAQPPVTINSQRESALATPQPASIDDAQAAMIASMSAAKRTGTALFDTPRVASTGPDAVPGSDVPRGDSDQQEDVVMADHSWMEFGENPAEEDIEYRELAAQVRSSERRLAKRVLSAAEQFNLLRMKEELAKLEKREPQRKRRPSEEENSADEESSDEDDGGDEIEETGPEAEGLRRSKRRKHAEQKDEKAIAIALKKGYKKTSGVRRRPRTAREVREQQANRDERAFFNRPRKNDDIPLEDPKARKTLFKNRLATQPKDGTDDIMAKVLQYINPAADAIAQRIAQGDVVVPDIQASTKEQQWKQIGDFLKALPADMDPRAKKVATAQMAELKRAAKNFGWGKVKAVDGKWLLQGMNSGLFHHQLEGSNWMISRELASSDPRGGILADAMGLGKTVTTLACMVGNPPEPKNLKRRQKATLVVVPASLLKQWEDEIEKYVKSELLNKVQIYKKSSKLKLRVIEDCDVVITTYAEILSSYNIHMTEADAASAELIGEDKWKELNQDQRGVLHQIEWYRIVLDEAHTIKNHRSKQTQACFALKSEYRWCLTGTPMVNDPDELYPYFKFFRLHFTSNLKQFKEAFGNPNSVEAAKRLSVMLHAIMKRRTFGQTMLGEPLISIPAPVSEQKVVKLSREEVVLYRLVEAKFREGINQQLRQDAEGGQKNYAHMLSKLLRLRQAIAHPFLLEGIIRELFDASDLSFLQRKLDRLNKSKVKFFTQIKEWVQPAGDEGTAMPFGKSNYGEHFEFGVFLKTVSGKKAARRTHCAHCKDVPESPQIANCHHIFCLDCIEAQQTTPSPGGISIPQYACPLCDTLVGEWTPYLDAHKEGFSKTSRQTQKSRKAKKDDIVPAFKPAVTGSWVDMCEKNPQLLLPSSKAIAVKALLTKWLNEAPNDKIIVFTQFRAMARVIGLMCQREKIGHLYFTGDMSHKLREEAIKKFKEDKKVKVMIANLKVGGVGLNLNVANRVISIDPWWNHCIEQQAFGRVFRLGQTKITHFVRLFAQNTVDFRIRSLQKDKINAIDEAMMSGKLSNLPPLSLEEIAGLFGQLVEGEDGVIQVQADYAEDDDPSPEFNDDGDSDSDDA